MSEDGLSVQHQDESVAQAPHNFSFFVATCFTLNYIIGSGFLTLPWAFYETGWCLGLFLLGLITLGSIGASWFILEAMARAEALTRHSVDGDNKVSIAQSSGSYHTISPLSSHNSNHSFMGVDAGEGGHQQAAHLAGAMVGARKFEIPELCEIFIGPRGRQVYAVTIGIYMYGTLWAYSTVFANACATQLPLTSAGNTGQNNSSYLAYLALFAVLMVPASLMELSEQITIQVSLSACRMLLLVVMLLSIFVAHVDGSTTAFGDTGESREPGVVWRMSKVYILLPIAAYANIFHHSIPSLSHPVVDKGSLGKIFTTALIVSWAAYAGIGTAISIFFGEHTKVASNLNWRSYVGSGIPGDEAPLYARLISCFVVLFPAMDVASAYPLNAITLGNNLLCAVYGSQLAPAMERSRMHRMGFRLLAAVPPLLLALVESNLGEITDFTGLTGFAVAFIFPALLSLYSENKLREAGIDPNTCYSNWWTRRFFLLLTASFGVFLSLFVASNLIILGPPQGQTRRC